ncbi:MAG: hypothetical protein ABSF33_03295 [Acidimicrobiales bacterium]|jgi:hypothetical protein
MTQSNDPEAAQAYTRTSVESYLSAAAAEQSRLGSAIAEAQRRKEAALSEAERLSTLQHGDDGAPERRNGAPATTRPDPFRFTDDEGHGWREQDYPAAVVATDVVR